MKMALYVFFGSGLGGVVRYLVSTWVSRASGSGGAVPATIVSLFPWATLAVNVAGCLLIGIIYAIADSSAALSAEAKTFLAAGFCGGLTTFSTFTHENYLLFQSHNFGIVLLYVGVSLIVGLCAAYAGHALVVALLK